MKALLAGCAALACCTAVPAAAQTTNDDVRCFLLSTGFAKAAKEEQSRRVSAMTAAFYLGRLDGRASPQALTAAARAQGKGMPAAQAAPLMRACAARAAAAQNQLDAAVRRAATP